VNSYHAKRNKSNEIHRLTNRQRLFSFNETQRLREAQVVRRGHGPADQQRVSFNETQRLREAQVVRRGHGPADQQRVRGERLSNKFNLLRITCIKLNMKYLIWHVFFFLRPLFFFLNQNHSANIILDEIKNIYILIE